VAALPPLTTNDPPLWLRHLHWLLALALIPLGVSLLSAHGDDKSLIDRIDETLERANPADRQRFEVKAPASESLDDLINALPDQRVFGAMLPRSTGWHWALAAVAAVLFLAFMMFLASDGAAHPGHVLAVGLGTATVGIGFLFLVQGLAALTDGTVIIGRGIIALVFFIFKFISFSYSAAGDPENGFLLSFLGFTLGVGLCEELVKAIPLFWYRDDDGGRNWRGLFIWGLASGAGFGIAEGILYSSRYYNGIAGPGTYAVRFLSCVALHAIWTGSVAVTLYLRRDLFDHIDTRHDWIGPVLFVIGVPMVLHGLYDTCLKKDLNGAALAVAVASFGYLAVLCSRLRGADDAAAQREMLREYKRRRAAMS
jgi:RsiW-degrading membrane proteinase PrsW (M82 family)